MAASLAAMLSEAKSFRDGQTTKISTQTVAFLIDLNNAVYQAARDTMMNLPVEFGTKEFFKRHAR